MFNDTTIELTAAVGQILPPEYLKFLDGLPSRPTLGDGYGPILKFDDRSWHPSARGQLAEPVQYGKGKEVPAAHETAAIAEMLRELDAKHDGEMSAALAESGFNLERLARGFCIGEDDNGEPLFVDAKTGGIFVYFHDGMDVEHWAGSLTELLAGSQDLLDDEDQDEDDDQSDDTDEDES